jgi:hypothetical protein
MAGSLYANTWGAGCAMRGPTPPTYVEYFGSMQYRLMDSKFGMHVDELPVYGPITQGEHDAKENWKEMKERHKRERKIRKSYIKDFMDPYFSWDIPMMEETIKKYDYDVLMEKLHPYISNKLKNSDIFDKHSLINERTKIECEHLLVLIEQRNPYAMITVENDPNISFIQDILLTTRKSGHKRKKK